MQGTFPKMESLPARATREEAEKECERLNAFYSRPKDRWNGMSNEPVWVKEIDDAANHA